MRSRYPELASTASFVFVVVASQCCPHTASCRRVLPDRSDALSPFISVIFDALSLSLHLLHSNKLSFHFRRASLFRPSSSETEGKQPLRVRRLQTI
uniref:Uncharacterized protein n=1 Tax=Cucumis melo TaxID=3656 RepID=A0A9I9E4A1_CUCME